MQAQAAGAGTFMTPADLLEHWQGHRRLTRRLLEAFPEDQLFTFAVGGMRSWGELVQELLGMAAPMMRGLATGQWDAYSPSKDATKAELLRQWDEGTAEINALWQQLAAERFHEVVTAFGVYEGTVWSLLMYVVDNEIHHRGQGYVYLRALGQAPPHFWERH